MVRSPLVWLGEPDPVSSIDTTQAEDSDLADLREMVDHWRDELKLDEPYKSASIVEAASTAPAGFNAPVFKQFLVRIASDKEGNVSAKRLGEWLRRNSGRVVRGSDERRYRLVRRQDAHDGRARFCLKEVI
jgi:putative DNA primase/helicase